MNTSKVIVITGASSGIGKACAVQFASKGWNVVISGRDAERLKQVQAFIHTNYPESGILSVKGDVSSEKDCEDLISQSIGAFGRIDVLINNAGISMRGLFADTDLNVLRTLIDTNFWGAVYCTKYALPYLFQSKGSVVGISSIAGKKGLPGRTGYSASKFALEGFLETLRIETLKSGLHVMVACPGFTASSIRLSSLGPDGTPQKESPREENKMMTADEVALRIYDGILKRKRDLIMTSNGKMTVFMNKFFPAFMDKVVYKYMAREPGSPFK
ncbi:MAG TPA: SDR family oxidoreductase [Bacteroidia bacterium]|nr:SDR family oxidoreductase [Bacteroidia bacterium]